jgi:DNA-binding NarL/FixJ family response regulator
MLGTADAAPGQEAPRMRVLIIDDHPMFRDALAGLMRDLHPGVEVVEAGSRAAALAVRDEPFDLVLLDLDLPDASPRSLDALVEVKAAFEASAVVVVSAQADGRTIRRAIELDASGYFPKTHDQAAMERGLRLVLSDGVYLPPELLTDSGPKRREEILADAAMRLSERQREVLNLALQGKPNKVIARELNIAIGTVKHHLSIALEALGIENRTEAIYRLGGLLRPETNLDARLAPT